MALQKIKTALGFCAKEKALTLSDADALTLFGAFPTTSGVSIGPGNAMRVPAVACAVGLISETIGALSGKLYDRTSKTTLTDYAAYRLVHDEANEWTSAAGRPAPRTLPSASIMHAMRPTVMPARCS